MPNGYKKAPSRRMTLGSMPSNQSSRRTSLGDASTASGNYSAASRRPPKSRASMIPRVGRENSIPPSPGGSSLTAPTAASRRRSVGGSSLGDNRRHSILPSQQSTKADPRPINDKVFKDKCIKQLYSFLMENGYEYTITPKSLARPSSKDFLHICTFMLRRIDPNFQRNTTLKFEDEVTLNFKAMGYPYTISKTSIVAAGAPHTWPALLAALSWLMESILCKQQDTSDSINVLEDESAKPFETLEELESKTDKAFFQYLGEAYQAFMRGDMAATERLETALQERFERDDAYLQQEVERMTDVNAMIVERMNALTKESLDLPTYAKKREAYASDLEQFHDLIRKMAEHKSALEQKVKERSAELAVTNEKLDKMTAHIADLKKMVEMQELSVDDIHKMESELKGLNEAMDRSYAVREQRRKALLETESELVKFVNELDIILADYNIEISDMQLVPEFGAQFANMKASLDKEKLLESAEQFLGGVDLRSTVQPTVSRCKADLGDKVDQTKADYQDSLDQVESSNDAFKEVGAKLKIIDDKKVKCEQTLESDQETLEAKLAVRQREVEAMESKVASLRDPVALEEQIAAYERQCAELEALRIEHQEENIAKKKAVQDEIMTACKLMMEHEEHFRRKVAELDQYWLKKQAAIRKVTVPDNIELDDE